MHRLKGWATAPGRCRRRRGGRAAGAKEPFEKIAGTLWRWRRDRHGAQRALRRADIGDFAGRVGFLFNIR